jgi:hypothetical protein
MLRQIFTWCLKSQHLQLWHCKMFCVLGKLWQMSPDINLSFMRGITVHLCSATSLSEVGSSLENGETQIHNEKSCWTDDKIQGMLHDIHFSVVETWSG